MHLLNVIHAAAEENKIVDRKSTRLNSSHTVISYAVFCLKKKKRDEHVLLIPQKTSCGPTPEHHWPYMTRQATTEGALGSVLHTTVLTTDHPDYLPEHNQS